MSNKELAKELHKPIIRTLEKRNIRLSFIDNIWGSDHTDIQLISKFDKKNCFLLCVISVNMEGFFLKEKKFVAITNAFPKIFKRA